MLALALEQFNAVIIYKFSDSTDKPLYNNYPCPEIKFGDMQILVGRFTVNSVQMEN